MFTDTHVAYVWITTDGQNTPGTTVEELMHLDLTLFKTQQEKDEIEVNLISTLPQQQTLNQLQTAIVLS